MSHTTARKGNYQPEAQASRPAGSSASDEFERFFAEQFRVLSPQPAAAQSVLPSQVAPVQAPPARVEPNFDDPLMAELARIVGHSSPVLPRRSEPALQPEPVVAVPEAVATAPADPLDAFEADLRRFDEFHRASLRTDQSKTVMDLSPLRAPQTPVPEHDPLRAIEDEFRRYEQAAPELRGAAPEPAYEALPEPAYGALPEPEPYLEPEAMAPVDQPRSRNRVVYMLGAAATIALVGVVGAVTMKNGNRTTNGETPLIAASNTPIKEKPADPGGVEIPGQDRQVLARGAVEPPKAANVVSREEQPVDLNQTPKRDVARVILPPPAGGTATAAQRTPGPIIMPPAAAAPQQPAPTSAGGFEAKRVRSVKVGPEGAAVAAPPPPAAAPVTATVPTIASLAAPAPVADTTAPVTARVSTPAPAPKTEARPAAAPPKSEARPATVARPQTTTPQPQRQAARTAPAAAAEDDDDDVADNKPLSLRPPAGASATRPVARTTSTAPATTASTGGGFAVQLAAAGNEAEARSISASMKQKHGALASYSPSWRASEVNGRTVYRVRVGGLSREKATELCGRIKSNGGSCFVAGN